ncbi:RICIN domain-containing protein [Sorangium sp. So ce269]
MIDASSIGGTWMALQNVGDSTAYSSQTAFVLPIQGSQTTSYLYMGDRWAGAWGGPVNDSQYVWLPLQFPSNTSMTMSYSDQVTIDAATGVVQGSGATYYTLGARHSGKCLDVNGASSADGAAVQQWSCNGGSNQQWQLQSAGSGYYRVVARHSGKCLGVVSSSTADGAVVKQYACSSGSNQQWETW